MQRRAQRPAVLNSVQLFRRSKRTATASVHREVDLGFAMPARDPLIATGSAGMPFHGRGARPSSFEFRRLDGDELRLAERAFHCRCGRSSFYSWGLHQGRRTTLGDDFRASRSCTEESYNCQCDDCFHIFVFLFVPAIHFAFLNCLRAPARNHSTIGCLALSLFCSRIERVIAQRRQS